MDGGGEWKIGLRVDCPQQIRRLNPLIDPRSSDQWLCNMQSVVTFKLCTVLIRLANNKTMKFAFVVDDLLRTGEWNGIPKWLVNSFVYG